MKRMIKGVEVLFNLAYMVREGETDQARLQNAATKALPALDYMVDYLVATKEAERARNATCVCGGQGCCQYLQCDKS